MPLKECCAEEAEASLSGHKDVATCDGCGNLLLAYADDETFQQTVDELESRSADFDTGRRDDLRIVAKVR